MERMNALDASFLYVEDGIAHMHIASCAVFEGPAPAYADVVRATASKLDLVPRYRQVVRFVPFGLGRPVWVDDPHFNLGYHLRHTALPAPGGPDELRHLMARLMSQELDRRRPLWEAWVVENLESDRWALISKIHHCLADGVSGTDLLAVMLDHERTPAAVAPMAAWAPEPEPSDLRLAADALVELARSPYDQLRAVRRMLGAPARTVAQARDLAGGARKAMGALAPTEPTSFVGPIGPHRRWTWADADLDDLKTIRGRFGGTVNDAILAVIAGGLRELLVGRGEPVDTMVVRSLVPVSVRVPAERGTYNNRVSAMFAELPVGIADPVERIGAVSRQMAELKASHEALAGEGLTTLAGAVPFLTVAGAERAAMRVMRTHPQHSIHTVTTNVPGPQFPLYLAGREMLAYLPFVPIAPGVRIGLAIVSYHGKVAFGITGDFDSAPDIEVLARAIEDGVAELVKLSGPPPPTRRARSGRTRTSAAPIPA